MRIIQLTDLHVGEEGAQSFGVDVRANFLKILQAAKALQPDRLVITGDLCLHTGVTVIYQWLKEHLDDSGIPYDVISGNHDDPALMAEVFDVQQSLRQGELYFNRECAGRTVLFLDTTVASMSEKQLEWLRRQLSLMQDDAVIFMHHPPMLANMPWMDSKYPFRLTDAFQEICFAHPYPINVFCGHYHIEKTVQQHNLTMHITPSCYFQIDPHALEFKIDHYQIALREIEIEGASLRHSVHYF
ncbi:MAG: metallophosphoesterase [Saprospiraceae bacterium]